MNTDCKISKIRGLFENLQKVLQAHRGSNYVAGVRSAICELSDGEATPDERIRHARSTFQSMMGGMGTLGDFVIWDEDEARRNLLNQELNELVTELWNLLEC